MAKLQRQVGTTSQIVNVFVLDTTSTTGAGKTGLTNASVTCYYKRNTGTASAASTVNAISTLGTYAGSSTNAGFKEVDSTNMAGLYEFDIPNNALASGADCVTLMLTGSGIHIDPIDIELTAINNQSTGFGLVNISANAVQFAGQTITAAAGVTIPSTIASPTNITSGTITTVTNLTNAPTAGDFTATMKTSIGTAVAASAVASVTAAVAITSNRKKGSGATFEFLMQDSTTGAPKTGLTVASVISKDGGAAASTSNSVTEIGLGQYQIILTGTEMTANNIFLQFTASAAVTSNLTIQTQP